MVKPTIQQLPPTSPPLRRLSCLHRTPAIFRPDGSMWNRSRLSAALHYGSKQPINETSFCLFSFKFGSVWVILWKNECSRARKQSEQGGASKWVSERTIEWHCAYILIQGCSEPQCTARHCPLHLWFNLHTTAVARWWRGGRSGERREKLGGERRGNWQKNRIERWTTIDEEEERDGGSNGKTVWKSWRNVFLQI